MNTASLPNVYTVLDRLPNGAELIAHRPLPQRPGTVSACIVLCYLPDNDVTPFATWQMNTADRSTYWGHYFEELAEAESDYVHRAR
jgi:hypothetical protein